TVLGLAYKPLSNVVDYSPGVWLCRELAERRVEVLAHDYAATPHAKRDLGDTAVRFLSHPDEAPQGKSALFAITCPWPQYREVFSRPSLLLPATVVDPWRLLEGVGQGSAGITLVTALN